MLNDSSPSQTTGASSRPAQFRIILRGVLIFAVYLLLFIILDKRAHTFEVLPGVVAWYPPDGLSLTLLLTFGALFLPVIAIASIVSSLFVFQFSLPVPDLITWAVLFSLVFGAATWFLKRQVHMDL